MAGRDHLWAQWMRTKARTRTIDHILSGKEYIASHDNTSQYALGGPSSCGIVAMNCIRHVLSLEKDGCTGEDLVTKMTEKDIVDDIMAVCNYWTSDEHLDIEDIYQTPLFESSLQLICSDYGTPEVLKFIGMLKQLDQLVKTSYTKRSCAVVITRPPEIIVCFKIVLEAKDLYVIFDSHPRQQHPEGAAFIFNTSLEKTALYLADLLPYDPRLFEESNSDEGRDSEDLQWQAQLLGNVSGHFFECCDVDMKMSPDAMNAMFEANFGLLQHRLQEKETKARIAALTQEIERLSQRVEHLQHLEGQTNQKDRARLRIRDIARVRGSPLRNVKHFAGNSGSPNASVLPLVPYSGGRTQKNMGWSQRINLPGSFPLDSMAGYTSESPSPPPSPTAFEKDDEEFESDYNDTERGDKDENDLVLAIRMQAKFAEEDTMLRNQFQDLQRQSTTQPSFECCICMDVLATDYVARIDTCGHSFCRECLRGYVTSRLEERRYPLLCPECGSMDDAEKVGFVTEQLIHEIGITEDMFLIFMELQMSGVSISLFCKKCNRSAHVDRNEYDAAGKIITCPFPNCLYTWCRDCQQPVALDGSVDDKGCVHSCDGSAELENLMGVRGWKHCPGCRIPTEKIEGCNHMRCGSPGCNTHFCYICGGMIVQSVVKRVIDEGVANHYSSGCILFDVPPE